MEKITVCEVANTVILENQKFIPIYAGVWLNKTNNDWTGYIDDDFPDDNLLLDVPIEGQIISVEVNNQNYIDLSQEPDPIDAIITNDSAFYFDQQNKALYIHFTDNKPPYWYPDNSIFIGQVLGFYKSSVNLDSYALSQNLAGNPYESRLLSTPALKTSLDDFFDSKPVFVVGSIKIDNTDRKYQNYFVGRNKATSKQTRSKIGDYVRVMQWEGESIINDLTYTTLLESIIFQGYIERGSESYNGDEYTVTFTVRDIRSSYKIKSPTRELDNSLWPDLKDGARKKILPHIWGECLRVPCLCLNESVTQTGSINYKFLLADSEKRNTKEILEVYLDGEPLSLTPTILYDGAQKIAYFEIAPSVFLVDAKYKAMNKITVDIKGYTDNDNNFITNSLDVVSAMLEDDQDILFNSVFYDLTQWNSVRDFAPSCGIYYDSPVELNRKIADIQKNLPGTKWDVTITRKQTWRNYRYSGQTPIFTIDETMIPRGWGPEINSDSTKILASFRIGYQKKFGTAEKGDYNYSTNNDNTERALDEYRTDRSKDFDMFVSDSADIADISTEILKLIQYPTDTFQVDIDSGIEYNNTKISSLRAGDFIWIWADLEAHLLYGRITCQIISQEAPEGIVKLKLKIEYNALDNFVQKFCLGDGFGNAIGDGHGLCLGGNIGEYTIQDFTVSKIFFGDGTGKALGDGNGNYLGGNKID